MVEAKNLSWKPAAAAALLNELSFEIGVGGRVVLTGPSGSGKSTLLRAIAGVLQQTEPGAFDGELYVRGRTGLLLQDPANSFVAATVGPDVAFGPENFAMPAPEIVARVEKSLGAVRLPYGVHRAVNELSGGESQRMALAGVLALEPNLLLLDEPTSMLDEVSAANIVEVISDALAVKPQTSAIIVDHKPGAWAGVATRVLILSAEGRLVGDLPMREFLAVEAAQPRGAQLDASALLGANAKLNGTTLPGKITALVGPSGAGKTTRLMQLLAKHEPAQVGWVPQQPEFTVVGNTVWQSATATVTNLGLETDLAMRLLIELGLSGQLDQNPYQLSGGELRRLALVSALAHHPSFLILDEPTVGQDTETWQAVAGVILAARAEGVDVVLATHDSDLIALADEVVEIVPTEVMPTPKPRTGRVAPLVALVISFALLGASFAINNLLLGFQALGIEAAIVLATWRILPQQRLKRFAPILIALASIWVSNALFAAGGASFSTLDRASVVTLRVAFFALPSVVLSGALRPAELAAALVRWFKVPARPAVAASAALVRLELIQWQWAAVRMTRRLRGFSEGRGPVARTREFVASLFALLVQSLRGAADLAVAMQARGFGQPLAKKRTWAKF